MRPSLVLNRQTTAPRIDEATIRITNLRLRTYIGFNDEERTKQQDVIVNAEIRYRANRALLSDDASDALNYKIITKQMIHHIEHGRFNLLERLTAELLAIATASDQVSFAEVTVDKPHALRFADSVSVTLSATRQQTADREPGQTADRSH